MTRIPLAEKGLRIEFQEAEQQRCRWGRLIKTKVPPEKIRRQPPNDRKRSWPHAGRALPKYGGIILDRKGERGVFVRIRYYSRKRDGAGVSLRVVKYVFNGADVDSAGRPYFVFNIGKDIDEALCAFDHLEQVNWAAQKNAKLMMHAIMAADYRQTPDEMMQTGLVWAEEALGRFNLPYVVTLHAPPEEGDERNWHLHILFSFRPMARTGDHEWQVGEQLRTDLDNPQAMRLMREMYASAMTISSYESGINQPYTAKSNAARGLVHEPQVHLGGMLTSMARNGYHIAKNEENFERVARSESAQLDEELRHVDEALAHEQGLTRSTGRRWARAPVLPGQIPQRIMATVLGSEVPNLTIPAQPWSAQVALPAIALPVWHESVTIPLTIGVVTAPVEAAAVNGVLVSLPHTPERSVMAAEPLTAIANLRFPLRQAPPIAPLPAIALANRPRLSVPGSAVLPLLPPRMASQRPQLPAIAPPRLPLSIGNVQAIPVMPTIPFVPPATPSVPSPLSPPASTAVTPAIQPLRPAPAIADAEGIGLTLDRVDRALEAYAKRQADRAEVDKARQIAQANADRVAEQERRHQAVRLVFAQIIAERQAIEKRDGKYRIDADLLAHHKLQEADIASAQVQAQLEKIADDRTAEAAVTPSPVKQEAGRPRGHSLAAWLHSARRADGIAAQDDDGDWSRRSRDREGQVADPQVEPGSSRRVLVRPRERGL